MEKGFAAHLSFTHCRNSRPVTGTEHSAHSPLRDPRKGLCVLDRETDIRNSSSKSLSLATRFIVKSIPAVGAFDTYLDGDWLELRPKPPIKAFQDLWVPVRGSGR